MKRILFFILPIIFITSVVFMVFGFFQVRFQEERLMDDLERKATSVAESMDFSLRMLLANNDIYTAKRIVERFQKRERLQGGVIYDKNGEILAVTERFSGWQEIDKPYIKDVLKSKVPLGKIIRFKGNTVYSYVLPVEDDNNVVLGLVEIIYDTSYVYAILAELWRRISIALVILVIFIGGLAYFLQHRMFTMPVERLTHWFLHFQKGEAGGQVPIQEKGELGKLVSEVEQVALSLKVARKAMAEDAQERIEQHDLWTEAKLRDLIHTKIGDNSFFVVSNREPYMHVMAEPSGKTKCVRPASGVVTAIDPILRACGGTWVAHGSGNMDKKFVNSKNQLGVPPEDIRYILKRVWLSKVEEDGYYYGFSNEGLWPLCHITHTRPIFRETDWQEYRRVNQKFADAVIEDLPANNPFVFIQDYHFTLLGKMIKEKRPDATIALFWHIPWPNPEVFSICPYYKEILEGMLGCDLIGFHVQYHCNNFMDTANRLLESRVDNEKFSVVRAGKETLVRPFPISVDFSLASKVFVNDAAEKQRIIKEYALEEKIVAVGVDRIDYTKGLAERVLAIDRFLEKNPQYLHKFVFIQLAAPSRTHIKRYHDLMSEIDELIEKTNWKYQESGWKPIIYLKRHFSPEEIRPYYSLADICIVSSLHDGMNLVAKEYIASNNNLNGSLILSKFTGAAKELTDAIQINPYSIEEFADAIKNAVEMPLDEKRKRMGNMRQIITENNVYKWAGNIVADMASLKRESQ